MNRWTVARFKTIKKYLQKLKIWKIFQKRQLLDGENNGFVISSLFIKEGNRVYTKEVKDGKSEHKLSKEETEAIKIAIKS